MSVGSLAGMVAASFAGSQSAEKNSGNSERAGEARNTERQVESREKADKAAGVGSADEQSDAAGDRDADGRRPWERIRRPGGRSEDEPTRSIDASGQLGKSLDLSG